MFYYYLSELLHNFHVIYKPLQFRLGVLFCERPSLGIIVTYQF